MKIFLKKNSKKNINMKIEDIIKITIGFILIIIGIIGGIIPIFQGWMFGIPGLIILSKYFKSAKKILKWAKKKIKKPTSDDRQDE